MIHPMKKTCEIKLKDYTLDPPQLENLAQEFYGKMLDAAIDAADELEIEFEDEEHCTQFSHALHCFVRR